MDTFIKIYAFDYKLSYLTCFRFNINRIDSYYELNSDSDFDSTTLVNAIMIVSNSVGKKLFFKNKEERNIIISKLDSFLPFRVI